MRVGKKPNVVEAKKTRSCVVRLEKVATKAPNLSPSPEDNRIPKRTTRLISTAMASTPKGRRAPQLQQEEKSFSGTIKRRVVGNNNIPQQQKITNINISNIRSTQRIKVIPRSNKTTPASTPSRDVTPPPTPTIAAGRSRRAIKPNPKYASEDVVTPKVVRNVATLGSSSGRLSSTGGKIRKTSTSSDDFYNQNSDDEYDADDGHNDEEDLKNDKAYQVNEKDDLDSDYSDIDEKPARTARSKGRPKKAQESQHTTITQQTNNKLPTQMTSSSIKRTATSTAFSMTAGNLRSAPSQLQQIRRSLASANTQRNLNLLAGSTGGMAQKRKLEEIQDSSDNESSAYTITRKQLLLSNSAGLKVKVPVRENRVNATTSTPIPSKSRLVMQKLSTQTSTTHNSQQQTVNGTNRINISQTPMSRRAIEISARSNAETTISKSSLRLSANATNNQTNNNSKTQNQNPPTHAKILATKTNRFRTGSPKLTTQKERPNNGSAISMSSASSSSFNTNKARDKAKAEASFENKLEIKDDSPNSTMDDFETMPTFTIVNVNDIINKKGDVLITKSQTNSNKPPTVIEFSESISLDDDDDDEDDDNDDVEEVAAPPPPPKKLPKLPTFNNRKEFETKKSPLTRSNESLRKLHGSQPLTTTGVSSSTSSSKTPAPPQILNHKLGLRNSRVTAKTTTTLTATLTSPDKPAPRILNSMVAKKTQPVKPMITNMDDSAEESFPLSLDEDEDEEEEEEQTEDEIESRTPHKRQITEKTRKRVQKQNLMEVDNEDTESQNTEEDEDEAVTQDTNYHNAALTTKHSPAIRRRTRTSGNIVVSSNNRKRLLTTAAAKENSLAATNQQHTDTTTAPTKQPTLPIRKSTNSVEKVVISKQGDKIIKKITCFETWYVINMPPEPKRPTVMKNQLEMPLIRLANIAKNICLPNDLWSSKVTLYELSPQTLAKGTFSTFMGDLFEHNIREEDRGKYQPSCVMFRRSIEKKHLSRMPYDRAVIFKNKTFYTNIEGKNVRLVGAPSIINTEKEIEVMLQVVDGLTLQSEFVEHISIVQ